MVPSLPANKKARVIVNTDAKNEADDQYAIVHALLTPSFEIRGIIPAHFGTRKVADSMAASRSEVDLLIDLMGMNGKFRVENGAPQALPDERTGSSSPGANLIIEEAMKEDPRPLHVAFYGPLTDMATAFLLEPQIAERDVRVIWIGGGPWPNGGPEYNLSNDIHAANVIFRSSLPIWQIPSPVYRRMAVSYAELERRVGQCGKVGRYLVDQLIAWNTDHVEGPIEYRSLGDSPAVGVMVYPDCGSWSMQPAPEFTADMHYIHRGGNRAIRVYDWVDARFIHEDFFAKLTEFAHSGQEKQSA